MCVLYAYGYNHHQSFRRGNATASSSGRLRNTLVLHRAVYVCARDVYSHIYSALVYGVHGASIGRYDDDDDGDVNE